MIPLKEAQQFVLDHCAPLPPSMVAIEGSLGCVVSEDVAATEPVPSFANSSMDGYAVRAEDTSGAPVALRVIGSVMAGHLLEGVVGPGEAARIMTGAPLPPGADAVCMIEETDVDPGRDMVTILRALESGNFVRRPGRDVAVGDVVAPAGAVLTPAHLGVLANQGVTGVLVHPRPRVGVLSTGDELFSGTGTLPPGKIRDANRPTLLALCRQEGWDCVDLGVVGDAEVPLVEAIQRGSESCDAILTSGGVSVGDLDLVRVVLEKLSGGTMRWMQVAIRPAKPFAFGLLAGSGTPVFGLPGNPVSAMVSFELFVRPALRAMGGHHSLHRPVVSATMVHPLARQKDGKLHLLRAQLRVDEDGNWRARTTEGQESHQLRAMAAANSLVLLPDGTGVPEGAMVRVLMLDADRLGDREGDGARGPRSTEFA